MKLFLIIVTLISFSCSGQEEAAFEFASYQNKDLSENNTPIVKTEHYYRIYLSGRIEVIDRAGKCAIVQIDPSLISKLKVATTEGLDKFRNKTKPPTNQFYAGYYSYLKMGDESVCFNPYDVHEKLKEALKNIEDAINKVENKSPVNCSIPDNLSESIQDAHAKSNLKTNASPPPPR